MADTSWVAVGGTMCALAGIFGWVVLKTQREHRQRCERGVKTEGVVFGWGNDDARA
jgi:hypothetical protein